MGCSPWGREESDTTERLHFHFSLLCTGEGNGNPLQCPCLENPRDGVAQSWTRLKWLSSSSSSINIFNYWEYILKIFYSVHLFGWAGSWLWRVGFSLGWLLLLRSTGSRCPGFSSCDSRPLESGLSTWGSWAQLLFGIWNLPKPGIKTLSPALAGKLLFAVHATTEVLGIHLQARLIPHLS